MIDVGCGDGTYTHELAAVGRTARVHGGEVARGQRHRNRTEAGAIESGDQAECRPSSQRREAQPIAQGVATAKASDLDRLEAGLLEQRAQRPHGEQLKVLDVVSGTLAGPCPPEAGRSQGPRRT